MELRIMEQFFVSDPPDRNRWIAWAWLVALYLAGAALWAYFFSWWSITLILLTWGSSWQGQPFHC